MPLKIGIKYGNVYVDNLKHLNLEETEDGLIVTYLDDPELIREIVDRAATNGQLDASKLSPELLSVLFELVGNHGDTLTDELKKVVRQPMRDLLSIVRVTSTEIGENLPLDLVTVLPSGEQVPLKNLQNVTFCTIYPSQPPQ